MILKKTASRLFLFSALPLACGNQFSSNPGSESSNTKLPSENKPIRINNSGVSLLSPDSGESHITSDTVPISLYFAPEMQDDTGFLAIVNPSEETLIVLREIVVSDLTLPDTPKVTFEPVEGVYDSFEWIVPPNLECQNCRMVLAMSKRFDSTDQVTLSIIKDSVKPHKPLLGNSIEGAQILRPRNGDEYSIGDTVVLAIAVQKDLENNS